MNACPECGNEERGQGGYFSCQCPAPPARVIIFDVSPEDDEIARALRNIEREDRIARSRPSNDHPRSPRKTR